MREKTGRGDVSKLRNIIITRRNRGRRREGKEEQEEEEEVSPTLHQRSDVRLWQMRTLFLRLSAGGEHITAGGEGLTAPAAAKAAGWKRCTGSFASDFWRFVFLKSGGQLFFC